MNEKRCSICGGPLEPDPEKAWDKGNNAAPVNNGRCCDHCNQTVVLPARAVSSRQPNKAES
jgi:hypothetical protein